MHRVGGSSRLGLFPSWKGQLETQKGTKAGALLTTEQVPQGSDGAVPFAVAVVLGPLNTAYRLVVFFLCQVKIAQNIQNVQKISTTLGKTFLVLADKGLLTSSQLTLALHWQ